MSRELALVYALKAVDHRCICENHAELIRDIGDMGPCAGNLLYDIAEEAIEHGCSCGPCSAWLGLAVLENRSAAREVSSLYPSSSPTASRAADR